MDKETAGLIANVVVALKRSEKEIELLKEKIDMLESEVYDENNDYLSLMNDKIYETCISFSYDGEDKTSDSTFKIENEEVIHEYIDNYILFLNGLGFSDGAIQKAFNEANI